MKLNQELIRARCQEIEESSRRIDKVKRESKKEFLQDQDAQDIACYRLMVGIEAALSLCYHVMARRLKKVPEEYAECFSMLAEAGIIPEDLSRRLQKMARFRNLLVHMYWKIDYGKVYAIIQHDMEDLRQFAGMIAALL